jgi:dTDP-4-dehydrorhamnose 3,5-epimerase
MNKLTVTRLDVAGGLLIVPKVFEDERGHFMETFHEAEFREAGVVTRFVQDNQSLSRRKGTVRGLHFQAPPAAQAKLVRVLQGAVFDVAVDLRKGSPSYGHWWGATLTAKGHEQLYWPRGVAHGFCTLEPDTVVAYKADNYYHAAADGGIFWNDPDIGIEWPVTDRDVVLSEKDRKLPRLRDLVSPFEAQ